MSRMYQAYARSASRAQCNPAVAAFAVIVIALAISGISIHRWWLAHEQQIAADARIAAAVMLCAAGLGVLAAAFRYAGQGRGAPGPDVPAVVPVTAANAETVPADEDAAAIAADADALAAGHLDLAVLQRAPGAGPDLIELGPRQ